ncbi:MAG: toll/interleukin-1 receptor domain-containing protein [Ferruginibacter sp.]
MNEFKKIFFSYSRIDGSDFVLRLATDLKKEGFDVWIDQQDIRAGSEWDLEIEKALETCDCLLFIESEKSVVSNNVLDEVYFALEQHKRVIPIIFHDSKTPFRLQRLQHIDFTTDYKKGFVNLINELKRDAVTELSQPGDGKNLKKFPATYSAKSSWLILIITIAVIIAAATFIYSGNDKKELNSTSGKIETLNETTGDSNRVDIEPKEASKKERQVMKEIDEKKEGIRRNDNKESNKTGDKVPNLNESFAGDWELTEVDPGIESKKGYLKIEELDEKKVKIQSFFQFYYFKTNDTAFLSVFNGFAGCSSCILQNQMPLVVEDIAVGTQTYKMLKEDLPGGGKAGDTILNAGSNKSIRASATLHLINKKTAIIKVQHLVSTPLSNGLVLGPFVYSFRFMKID